MNQELAPAGLAAPAAAYALGVVVVAPSRIVHTAGIVGTRPDGTISDEVGEQAAEVWRSVLAVLAEAGLGATDVVAYTTYVVDGEDLGAVMAARDDALDGHRAASTLVPVPRLAQPQWKVETAVIAAG